MRSVYIFSQSKMTAESVSPTSLVFRLLLGLDQVHLSASDAQCTEINDSTEGSITQVALVYDVGFGLVGLEHEVFQSQELVLLRFRHSLKEIT